jgi:GT2 family glycosyltransferase
MLFDVSVIITNYNTKELLQNCIESIVQKTIGITYEIIVVDNHSSDDSTAMIKERFPAVLLIGLDANLGFGRANNIGASKASGEYFFFLNSDTILENNAVKELFDFLENNPNCAICGGNLKDFNDVPIHSFGKYFPNLFSDIYLLCGKLQKLIQGKNFEYNYTSKPKRIAYITGADMMIRADVFKIEKGFNPNFFMYYEETELTYRIKKSGWAVYSVPKAKIYHKKGASLANISSNDFFYASKYYYFNKVFGIRGMVISYIFFTFISKLKKNIYIMTGNKEMAITIDANINKARQAFKQRINPH